MSVKLDELKREAAKLSEAERAELALTLIESLDGPADAGDIEEAWRVELDRRSAELASGEVTAVPGDEVFAGLHALLSS